MTSKSRRATTRRRSSLRAPRARAPRGRGHGGAKRTRSSCRSCPAASSCGAGRVGAASTSPRPTARTISRSSRRCSGSRPSTCSTTSGRRSSTTWAAARARRVLTPDAIPAQRLRRYGVTAAKLAQFPGLKEEYYLADFTPDRGVLDELGLDPERVLVAVRPPPDVSLYHRKANRLFPQVLDHIGRDARVQAAVLPRTEQQRRLPAVGSACPRSLVPERRGQQPQPRRARRPRRLGGRDDEPRGGRARHAGPTRPTAGGSAAWTRRSSAPGRLRPLSDPRAIELVKRAGPGAGELVILTPLSKSFAPSTPIRRAAWRNTSRTMSSAASGPSPSSPKATNRSAGR